MVTTLPAGIVLQGQFRIVRVLGIGGMGAVYLAEDTSLFGQRWAVKELLDSFTSPQERAAAWKQFEQEARILVALDHPNLPKIVRHFSENGRLYLVMTFIEGQTLEKVLEQAKGPLPETQVLEWAKQICDVLQYLHSQSPPVVFRDLKPSNIMLGRDGRIFLIDFGIARLFDPTKQTDTLKMGSRGYAPPEQYAGMGRTDPRSDIYGLGATLYHLLTGMVPAEAILRILPQPVPLTPPRRLNPALSQSAEQAVLTAMNVDPGRRFQSAAQMRASFAGQQSPIPSGPMQPCPRCGNPVRLTAQFCSRCGLPLASQPPPVQPPPVRPPPVQPLPTRTVPTRRHSAGLWWWGAGGAALVSIVLLAILGIRQCRPPGGATPTAVVATAAIPTDTASAATVPPLVGTPVTSATTPAGGPSPEPTTVVGEPPEASPSPPTPAAAPTEVPLAPGDRAAVGQPWEQDAVSLVVTNLEVRAEADYEDAAARVWYRFFNKTSQRLLVDVDWNTFHLEDDRGTRYVDWEGGGTTSVWVDAGGRYDFDRYYTVTPGERSRVPAGSRVVEVVVERFSRVVGARWRYGINEPLAPIAAPDPSGVKGVGEGWQEGDLELILTGLEVRAESDSGDAAARAWYTLSNRGTQRLLVEVDLSYLYLVDSYGQRFSDWEGGGQWSFWLEAGQSQEFDRYYTQMAGWKSRIARGAEFVLVKVDRLGSLGEIQWQYDIAR